MRIVYDSRSYSADTFAAAVRYDAESGCTIEDSQSDLFVISMPDATNCCHRRCGAVTLRAVIWIKPI